MSDVSVELKPKPAAALQRSALKLRESTNNSWRIVAARGVTRERLLDPSYYSVVGDLMLPYDKLHIIAEDRSYYCELLVTDCGRGYASVTELLFAPLEALLVCQDSLPSNHEIIHLGADDLYGVKRTSDGVLLGKGFASRQAAVDFLLDHATLR